MFETQKDLKELRSLGARRRLWVPRECQFRYSSRENLGQILETLRDAGYAFVGGPGGWPPAAVFEELREKGLVKGPFVELTAYADGRSTEITR